MTLANYILKRAGIDKDRPHGLEAHMARIPGLHHRERGWEASVYYQRKLYRVGVYPTTARAILARKLWLYWAKCGYAPYSIPRQQEYTAFQ